MRTLQVEVERLYLLLEGLPQSTVEEALDGLGVELRVRLLRARLASGIGMPVEVERVAITANPDRLDAASLRTMIAEQLVEQIERAVSGEERR